MSINTYGGEKFNLQLPIILYIKSKDISWSNYLVDNYIQLLKPYSINSTPQYKLL